MTAAVRERLARIKAMSATTLYILRSVETGRYWGADNTGYVTDITEAHIFTKTALLLRMSVDGCRGNNIMLYSHFDTIYDRV